MALKVWLPLSGNTDNYGLSDAQVQSIGSIMYASGLFGSKCFKSGDGAVDVHIASFPSVFTLTMWVKPDSPAMSTTLIELGTNGDRIDLSSDTRTYKMNGGSIVADNTTIFAINDGEWSHVAITADGRFVKAYVNGELVTEVAQLSTFAASDIYIGQRSNGTNGWDGYIQDVKLYNYIISTRELQNMSLGLALNYTFNHNGLGNVNLMVGSAAVLHVSGVDKVNRVENNSMYAVLEADTYILSAETSGTWVASNSSSGASVVNSDPSAYPVALELYTLDSNDTVASRIFVNMTGGFGTVTIDTAGTYYLGGIIYSDGVTNVEADFYAVKLEKGTTATAWIPPVGSPEYEYYEIGKSEQDVSGNRLDGTMSSPAPIWTEDSRIYTGSYDFSNNSYIESPILDIDNLTNYTISVWAKTTSFTNGILFGFNTNPRFNFSTIGGVFGIYDTDAGSQVPFGEGVSVSSYTGEWHHFAITGDGSVNTLYIDGVLVGSTSKYFALGRSKLYINGWDNSNNYNYNGLLSDFRIYAISMTADQIDSLVHNRFAVDDTGKLYSNEIVGNGEKLSISKNGVIKGSEFTVFSTPINNESVSTNDVSRFSVSSDKICAVDMYEV